MVKFEFPLIEGQLVRRYKRFLADVKLPDGTKITAHTANTGAMTGCSEPGSRVWLSRSDNVKRKYPYTWELVEASPGVICGINTLMSNRLVRTAIESGAIAELSGYQSVRSEVKYGVEGSRIDLLLEDSIENKPRCYVEVKNVTLVQDKTGFFPDAVSTRGTKHLRELINVVEQGNRAVIFFCVQRNDCQAVRPADHVDKVYGDMLRKAIAAGVEVMAWCYKVSAEEIVIDRRLTVCCDE